MYVIAKALSGKQRQLESVM